jgi:hypothetical protein
MKREEKKLLFYSYFQIRAEIIKILIDFYQKIPTAKYYEVPSSDYKHGKKKN